jgi:hypothetical protein
MFQKFHFSGSSRCAANLVADQLHTDRQSVTQSNSNGTILCLFGKARAATPSSGVYSTDLSTSLVRMSVSTDASLEKLQRAV